MTEPETRAARSPGRLRRAYRCEHQTQFITAAHRAGKLACDLRDPKLALRFYDVILQERSSDHEAANERDAA